MSLSRHTDSGQWVRAVLASGVDRAASMRS